MGICCSSNTKLSNTKNILNKPASKISKKNSSNKLSDSNNKICKVHQYCSNLNLNLIEKQKPIEKTFNLENNNVEIVAEENLEYPMEFYLRAFNFKMKNIKFHEIFFLEFIFKDVDRNKIHRNNHLKNNKHDILNVHPENKRISNYYSDIYNVIKEDVKLDIDLSFVCEQMFNDLTEICLDIVSYIYLYILSYVLRDCIY